MERKTSVVYRLQKKIYVREEEGEEKNKFDFFSLLLLTLTSIFFQFFLFENSKAVYGTTCDKMTNVMAKQANSKKKKEKKKFIPNDDNETDQNDLSMDGKTKNLLFSD